MVEFFSDASEDKLEHLWLENLYGNSGEKERIRNESGCTNEHRIERTATTKRKIGLKEYFATSLNALGGCGGFNFFLRRIRDE